MEKQVQEMKDDLHLTTTVKVAGLEKTRKDLAREVFALGDAITFMEKDVGEVVDMRDVRAQKIDAFERDEFRYDPEVDFEDTSGPKWKGPSDALFIDLTVDPETLAVVRDKTSTRKIWMTVLPAAYKGMSRVTYFAVDSHGTRYALK